MQPEELKRLVEERRQLAKQMRLDEIVCDLYYNCLPRSAYTRETGAPAGSEPEVLSVRNIRRKFSNSAHEYNISGLQLTFAVEDSAAPMIKGDLHEYLTVSVEEKEVFIQMVEFDIREYGTLRKPGYVCSFIEGPWVGILQRLHERHQAAAAEREKRWKDDQLIAEAKRFGIDPDDLPNN